MRTKTIILTSLGYFPCLALVPYIAIGFATVARATVNLSQFSNQLSARLPILQGKGVLLIHKC